MNKSPILIAFFAVAISFASCKTGQTGLLIPKDASFIMEVNNSSITSKLSWKEIQQSNWFKEAYTKTNDSFAKKLLDNPEASGIDIKSNFALFLKKQGLNNYFVFEGNIKDASSFENFVKTENRDSTIKNDGDLKYVTTKDNALVTWSATKFIIVGAANFNPSMNNGSYSLNTETISPDSMRVYARNLYNLKSDESVESDDHFKTLIKDGGDINVFINMGQYFSTIGGGMLDLLKVNSLFEGNVSTYAVNFDAGKISVTTKNYYGPTMKAILDKYSFNNVTDDQLKRIPANNTLGAFVMNFQPEMLKEILKAAGLDGMVNGFLGKENYSLDELISALKGQIEFSVSNLLFHQVNQSIEGMDQTIPRTKPDVTVLFGASVNNLAAFNKLLNILKLQTPASATASVNYKINNGWFAISNSALAVDTFLNGGNGKAAFTSELSHHPFGMYIDIQRTINSFKPVVSDSSTLKLVDLSAKMWQDAYFTGGDYKNGISTGNIVINLVDKSTNSLKQINNYADQVKAINDQRPKPEYTITDSTTVNSVPLPDTTNSTH